MIFSYPSLSPRSSFSYPTQSTSSKLAFKFTHYSARCSEATMETLPKRRGNQKGAGQMQTPSSTLITPESALVARTSSKSPSPTDLGDPLDSVQDNRLSDRTAPYSDPRGKQQPYMIPPIGGSWADIAMEREMSGQSLVTSVTSVESNIRGAVSLPSLCPELDLLAELAEQQKRLHPSARQQNPATGNETGNHGSQRLDSPGKFEWSYITTHLPCPYSLAPNSTARSADDESDHIDRDATESDPDIPDGSQKVMEPDDGTSEVKALAAVLFGMRGSCDG
jgi:hypothetical protein